MKTRLLSSFLKSALMSAAVASLATLPAFAQTPAPVAAPALSLPGLVQSVDAATRTLKMKGDDGTELTVVLAEKGSVMKVAPGEKSLQNAATIAFDGIAVGDRVLVRGGARVESRVDGALRVVVMAKTDLAARDAEDQKAWRERAIVGTVTAVSPASHEFTIRLNVPAPPAAAGATPAPPPMIAVDASKATLHRYADTSAKFDDAKPARVEDIAEGDQLRFLGTRTEGKATADRVVFGSFKTRALSVEKLDAVSGQLSVKDLETNQKFTVSMVAGGTIRRIPAEMAAMLGGMAGGGAGGGGRFGGGQGRPGGAPSEGGAPQGGMGARPGGMGGRPQAMGGGRSMADMVDRMPAITLAELKKDDWIGAVVGKIDASGHAIAFNMLAGIEIFAARANRGGGVDVGMPAGLLDGGVGVP